MITSFCTHALSLHEGELPHSLLKSLLLVSPKREDRKHLNICKSAECMLMLEHE